MSNTRPAGANVLIRPDSETTDTGLIRSLTKKTPTTGTILAVSDDYAASVAVGDRVQYSPNHRMDLDDGTILLPEDNILFIFN